MALVALIAWSNRSTSGEAGSSRKPPPTVGERGWEITSEGDFEERTVDTVGSRLRLRAATRGMRNELVKFLGLRRREEVRLPAGTRVSADLDWNRQANGSGLSAGLVLSPAVTSGNPLESADSLRVEYIGVPPGANARMVIAARKGGRERFHHTEGWPDAKREGRKIGLQRIEIVIEKGGAFRVLENGKDVYASGPDAISFDRAFVYLQMSTRSNYPPREVFFDNVVVVPGR